MRTTLTWVALLHARPFLQPDQAAAAPSQGHQPASLSQQPVASSATALPDGPDHGAAETRSWGGGNAGPAPASGAEAPATVVAPAKRVLPVWMTGQAAKAGRARSKAAATAFALTTAATEAAAVPDAAAGGAKAGRPAPKRRRAAASRRAKDAAAAAAASEAAEDGEEEAAVVAPASRRARLGKLRAAVPLSDDEADAAAREAAAAAAKASSQPAAHEGSLSAEQMLDLLMDPDAAVPAVPAHHGHDVPQTPAMPTSGAAALRSVARLAADSPLAVPGPPSVGSPPRAAADDAGTRDPLLYADHVPWVPPPPLPEMLPPVRVVSLREKLAALLGPDV